eukprot:CAMPEP_0172044206 /NCGR_PEP_ID=MMETSP1041-20130122/26668_1 /TAXON_ID=464988 /ORGANISM="Hemiselmis andersenii, Strain CCMP439" /LENGTH=148 /DNA_ID=CAMNT_0012702675 /DNA_START=386 /DNA_END=831 /DNA_ORIENTATION=-
MSCPHGASTQFALFSRHIEHSPSTDGLREGMLISSSPSTWMTAFTLLLCASLYLSTSEKSSLRLQKPPGLALAVEGREVESRKVVPHGRPEAGGHRIFYRSDFNWRHEEDRVKKPHPAHLSGGRDDAGFCNVLDGMVDRVAREDGVCV